jgi:hypothetical protein
MASARIGATAHRVHVAQCIGGRDAPEIERIVDDRHEEVGGGDDRLFGVDLVHGRIVRRFRADEQPCKVSGGRGPLEQVAQDAWSDLAAAATAV